MHFVVGNRPMIDTTGSDQESARSKLGLSVRKLQAEGALDHWEELILGIILKSLPSVQIR